MIGTTSEHRVATVRVSVREIGEATRWAFIAAGCSAGEAGVAARIVQHAEVENNCGVDAALRELESHEFSDQPVRWSDDVPVVMSDGHGRGVLTLGPLAAALAASRGIGRTVVLQGCEWHPVLASVLAESLEATGVGRLAAWPVGPDGEWTEGVLAIAGTTHAMAFDPSASADQPSAAPVLPSGIAFCVPGNLAASESPSRSSNGHRASIDGVEVDAVSWSTLLAAAYQFLVEDQ